MSKNIFTGKESKKDEVNPLKKAGRSKKFEEEREHWTDREIQMELLYGMSVLIDKMDKTRGNTNTLVWWLVILPIVLSVILYTIFEQIQMGKW